MIMIVMVMVVGGVVTLMVCLREPLMMFVDGFLMTVNLLAD